MAVVGQKMQFAKVQNLLKWANFARKYSFVKKMLQHSMYVHIFAAL
jgi:hypothetical protein